MPLQFAIHLPMGKRSKFKNLRWSVQLTSTQGGEKLSSALRSKGTVGAPWIPCPNC